MVHHLRATGRHLPYGITQCYLSPDTSERAPPNPSHASRYSIYLPRRDGRLSWPESWSWKLVFFDKPITLHDSSENSSVEEWNCNYWSVWVCCRCGVEYCRLLRSTWLPVRTAGCSVKDSIFINSSPTHSSHPSHSLDFIYSDGVSVSAARLYYSLSSWLNFVFTVCIF